jgi:D-serine deaminase-like pyridoxal phosphate-dependent protein
MDIAQLDTPAVLIDVDVMENNLRRMAEYCRQSCLDLRPHTKTHKIPELALRQVQHGAVGITVAKLGEAEVMVAAGLTDILIAYPIFGEPKWRRLVSLAERATITVAMDSLEIARAISAHAVERGVTIGIRVEFDTGFQRCGLPITGGSIDIVKQVRDLPGLRWDGIQLYPGQIMGTRASREVSIPAENETIGKLLELLPANGIECPVVSGGNTPAAYQCHRLEGVTEIRPGTYIFNDRNTVGAEAATYSECAATVLTTVVSTSVSGKAMVDAGSKTLAADTLLSGDRAGYGFVPEDPGLVIEDLSEEHGHLDLRGATRAWRLGDRIRIIPNHICPCMNLQDWVYGVRATEVVEEWRVAGRGKLV